MHQENFKIANTSVQYYFDTSFKELSKIVDKKKAIIITDENVMALHSNKFHSWKTIVIKAGEAHKQLSTIQFILDNLVLLEADRNSILIGVGGGVVTDITGFAASIYMRGLSFGFVPTTLLNLVDASLGGKNGVDLGLYKNLIGTINQPSFILQDISFLKTLPDSEWENGFAEIIKHACIKDAAMFKELSYNDISFYQKNKKALADLLKKNVLIKLKVVQKDVNEKGDRKMLNFGHTIGHAIENTYQLSHGHAIAIGMQMAAHLSEQKNGFPHAQKIKNLLVQYHLPVQIIFNAAAVFNVLKMDKKRNNQFINFILLTKIGKASIEPISLNDLKKYLHTQENKK